MKGYILLCATIILFLNNVEAASYFCPETTYIQSTRSIATTIPCGSWGRSRCVAYRLQYYNRPVVDEKKCCANFTGENCDIPVCNPACTEPAPCIIGEYQNICYCGAESQGDTCELAACSPSNNCFPGTCVGVTTDCACSPGYSGENCTKVLTAGQLASCQMRFIQYDEATEINLATFDCKEPATEILYTSANDADYLDLDYTVTFEGPITPAYPPYIRKLDIGLIESGHQISLTGKDNEVTEKSEICIPPEASGNTIPSQDSPYQTINCRNIRTQIDKAKIQHLGNLSIVINAESGGHKEFLVDNQPKTAYYTGIVSTFARSVKFDLESPTHCSVTETDCSIPCASYPDIMNRTEVDVVTEWFGWLDVDSGILTYMVNIYKMSTGSDGKLTEINLDDPLFTRDLKQEHKLGYKFENPGMYSIRLQVFDKAGNSYSARSLVLFDPVSDITVDENKRVTVDNTFLVGDRLWYSNPDSGLVIRWGERYANNALHSNNWLKAVKDESDNLFDDFTGNRTIQEIPNKRGIVQFFFAYDIDDFDELKDLDSLQPRDTKLEETYTMDDAVVDGKAFRFFITAIDALGNKKVEVETVHFDSSEATYNEEGSDKFINDDSGGEEFPYATRINLDLLDKGSGIQSISYTVYDVSGTREEIYSGSKEVEILSQDCDISECYCLSYGPCYAIKQTIWIDHCQLTNRLGRTLRLGFSVINGADIIQEYFYNIGILDNPSGIGYYPPPTGINHQGDVPRVTITWVVSPSCYDLQLIRLTISADGTPSERELTAGVRRYELDTLQGTNYAIVISAVYAGGEVEDSESVTFKTTGEKIQVEPTGAADFITTTAVLGGISVGGAIFLALVVLIIVMLVRKKQQKPVVPPVLREKAVRLRNGVSSRISRISQYFGRQSEAEDDGDEEKGVTTRSRRRRSFGFRLSKYSVQDGKTSHEGKRRGEKDSKDKEENKKHGGRMKKGVSFEAEDTEEAKPKSILKPVLEASENTEKETTSPTTTAAAATGSSEPSTSHALSAEVKKYGKMVVPKDASWIIADGMYSLGNAVSNTHGCFSEMRLATLRDQGSTNVVAKTNRPGASYEDKMQMTALMNFMSSEAPKHDNIVAFLGAVPPTAHTAPILFFEYCDEGSLLNWVKETRNVTDEVEDQMINFAIHIETGMDHMHLNGMLHRKLRAAHILLKHSFANQMVAKISGFGPENDTVVKDDEGEDSTQRWVAPEQYNNIKLFTHKTDIWSYGILLHEMFNMGKEPYSGMSVTEMKESVKSGFRMGKPKYGPEFMYDGVMKQCWQENQSDRPDFSELSNVMTSYFEGGKGEAGPDLVMMELADKLNITA